MKIKEVKVRKGNGFVGMPTRGAHMTKKRKLMQRSRLKLQLRREY